MQTLKFPLTITIFYWCHNLSLCFANPHFQGKGKVTTYFLIGKDGFDKPLPDLSKAATLEEHEFKWLSYNLITSHISIGSKQLKTNQVSINIVLCCNHHIPYFKCVVIPTVHMWSLSKLKQPIFNSSLKAATLQNNMNTSFFWTL